MKGKLCHDNLTDHHNVSAKYSSFSKDRIGASLSRGCLLSSRLIRVSRYEYCPVNDMFECYSEMRTTMAGVNANVH